MVTRGELTAWESGSSILVVRIRRRSVVVFGGFHCTQEKSRPTKQVETGVRAAPPAPVGRKSVESVWHTYLFWSFQDHANYWVRTEFGEALTAEVFECVAVYDPGKVNINFYFAPDSILELEWNDDLRTRAARRL